MRRLFLLAFTAFATMMVYAQPKTGTISVIPRAGLSLSNVTDMDIYANAGNGDTRYATKYKPGFTLGADIQYQATNSLAVSIGVFYTREGFRYSDMREDMQQGSDARRVDIMENTHVDMDYINVPLMAHYYIAENFSVNAGIQLGFLASSRYKVEETSFEETKKEGSDEVALTYLKDAEGNVLNHHKYNTDWSNLFKKLSVSIPISLSYEYSHVMLDARYNIPLTKNGKRKEVYDSSIYLPGEVKNKTFLFTVGYRFNL